MKRLSCLCISLICLVSCTEGVCETFPENPNVKNISVKAVISSDTKTSFDGASKTLWKEGDAIAVAEEGSKQTYILTTSQNGATAVFTGSVPSGFKAGKAFYPASAVVEAVDNGFSYTQQQTFQCPVNGFGNAEVPMCAKFDDIASGLSFSQTSALVKVTVKGDNVKSISLDTASGSDAGYLFAELCSVDCTTLATTLTEGGTAPKLVPASGASFAPGSYFFCIPASDEGRRFDGLKVSYELTNGTVLMHRSSNPLEVRRGKVYTIPGDESACTETVPKSVKLLCIGNSFSADAVEQELYGFFKAAGIEVIIGDMYIGGCPLEKHAANAAADKAAYSYRKIVGGEMTKTADVKLSTALKDEQWDFISIQEGAGFHGYYDRTYTTVQGSTFSHKMETDLTYLINYCKTNSSKKDFKLIYHAPWAAQKGYTGVKFSYYSFDQKLMYDMIVEATGQVLAAHPEIDIVMNSMDAVQNGRTSYIGDNFNRDGWHMNFTVGRYTVGALWFEKLTGLSSVGNPYHPATISDYKAKVCQTAAHEAVCHPYKITDLSARFTDPGEGGDDGNKVLAEWYFSPARAVSDGCVMSWTGQNTLGVYRYSLEPGERGYYPANEAGAGRIAYVQIDKTAYASHGDCAGLSTLDVSNGGQPVMCGPMAGDYWLFETNGGYEFDEGTELHLIYTYNPGSYGAMYWMIEYWDGDAWKPVPAFESKEITIAASGEHITYNVAYSTSQKVIDFSVTLENPTREFKVRQRCCSEYQVNSKYFEYPNVKCVSRIAGDPANDAKPCPKMTQILN